MNPTQPTLDSIAQRFAYTILKGFDKHYRLFQNISAEAALRFAHRDWAAVTQANIERINMYDQRVKEATQTLLDGFSPIPTDDAMWVSIKRHYIGLLYEHRQPELAETFYNSVVCRLLDRDYYHNRYIFFRPAMSTEFLEGSRRTFNSYYPNQSDLSTVVRSLLQHYEWRNLWADFERDVAFCVERIGQQLSRIEHVEPNLQIQMLSSPFYRNKGAYLIGRIINGSQMFPVVFCLQHNVDGELVIDALLQDTAHFYTLFSFTRAYFMIDIDVPSAAIAFLHELMPRRLLSDLYTMLGWQKHGKTLFYRDLQHHLGYSFDQFVIAPGIRGMVMEVFVLPSFPYVFKIIKDKFAPPKEVNRQMVKDKYQLVKYHDRVGRLADTLEFSKVDIPLARISPELLIILQDTCANSIEIDGQHLIIQHLYIERRMVPLNIYLAEAEEAEQIAAIHGYGQAIRDLAGVNIFPGDMLLKNFGVTRGGRVVFYDYDEIAYITDCRFRKMPPASSAQEEMLSEVWYSVGANDVFPEQFSQFTFPKAEHQRIFMDKHADLLAASWWRAQKQAIEAGKPNDFYPYPDAVRNPALLPKEG